MNIRNHPAAIPTGSERRPYGPLAVAVCTALFLSAPLTLKAETAADKPNNPPVVQQQNTHDNNRPTSVRQGEIPSGIDKASELIGRDVRDAHGESIGEIKDLALVPSQERIPYAVMSVGGVIGVGAELHAVPLAALDRHGDDELVLNMSKQQLDSLQGFDDDNWPAIVSAHGSYDNAGTAAGDIRGNASTGTTSAATGTVVKAKEYMDYEVNNLNGDKLGEVKDLAVDLNNGTIQYAVIDHGGLMELGDTLIAVPIAKLAPGADEDELVLNATDEELDRIKGFSDDSWPSTADDMLSSRSGQAGNNAYR